MLAAQFLLLAPRAGSLLRNLSPLPRGTSPLYSILSSFCRTPPSLPSPCAAPRAAQALLGPSRRLCARPSEPKAVDQSLTGSRLGSRGERLPAHPPSLAAQRLAQPLRHRQQRARHHGARGAGPAHQPGAGLHVQRHGGRGRAGQGTGGGGALQCWGEALLGCRMCGGCCVRALCDCGK